jgi:hypothetical protein
MGGCSHPNGHLSDATVCLLALKQEERNLHRYINRTLLAFPIAFVLFVLLLLVSSQHWAIGCIALGVVMMFNGWLENRNQTTAREKARIDAMRDVFMDPDDSTNDLYVEMGIIAVP